MKNKPPKTLDAAVILITIFGRKVLAIVDTGAATSVTTKDFLESIDFIIEEPSNVDLIDVNGGKKRALGIIRDVPVATEHSSEVYLDLQVSDATTYDVILGND